MCKFFSLCSQGSGKPLYFDSTIRKKIIKGEKINGNKYETTDSHTSIAHYFGFEGLAEDKLNKYEYDVWTKRLEIDHLGAKDDSKLIKDFCDNLDWTTIVPELKIKPIIHPFEDIQTLEVTKADIKLLKEWASVWASVGASVRASVWASVGASVWASVWASVGDSVWASVWAYVATFVDTKYKYNLTPAQKLWERGLVASFDGTSWRIHGYGGKEIYKITKEELKKFNPKE